MHTPQLPPMAIAANLFALRLIEASVLAGFIDEILTEAGIEFEKVQWQWKAECFERVYFIAKQLFQFMPVCRLGTQSSQKQVKFSFQLVKGHHVTCHYRNEHTSPFSGGLV